MHDSSLLVLVCVAFLLGASAGAVLLARWYVARMKDPVVARDVLKNFYMRSHPHWLKDSPENNSRICPCCGWSESVSIAQPQVKTPQIFGVKIVTVTWAESGVCGVEFLGTRAEAEAKAEELRSLGYTPRGYVDFSVHPYTGPIKEHRSPE